MSRKSFLVAVVGALVQYYDYHLFGYLAFKISEYFIPTSNSTMQLINTYFIMAVAVLAKPFGAIVLGRIGDIYGRSSVFTISLLGTAVSSLFLAILPGYGTIGLLSSFALLIARMAICAFTSSGTDGVRIYVYEKINKKYQCLGNGLVSSATLTGSFIASVTVWFLTLDFMPEYSWRLAFAFGGMLGMFIVLLRNILDLPNELQDTKQDPLYHEFKDTSLFNILGKYKKLFISSMFLAGGIGSVNQFVLIFFGTYIFKVLGYLDQSTMQLYTNLAIASYIIFSTIGGYIADILGRKAVFTCAAIALIVEAGFMASIINTGRVSVTLYLLICMTVPFLNVPALAFLKRSIPPAIRYRVFSLAHASGSILISAPTAFVSTSLYYKTQLNWIPMLLFMIVVVIMLIVVNILDYLDTQKHIKEVSNYGSH